MSGCIAVWRPWRTCLSRTPVAVCACVWVSAAQAHGWVSADAQRHTCSAVACVGLRCHKISHLVLVKHNAGACMLALIPQSIAWLHKASMPTPCMFLSAVCLHCGQKPTWWSPAAMSNALHTCSLLLMPSNLTAHSSRCPLAPGLATRPDCTTTRRRVLKGSDPPAWRAAAVLGCTNPLRNGRACSHSLNT